MRKQIRQLLQQFGYDIIKHNPSFNRGRENAAAIQAEFRWLQDYGFRTIIDIGANEGQFADKIRLLFPEAAIHAFEPLPGVFGRLKNNFSADKKFHPHNKGLGDKREQLQFWENAYSPSSSFLSLGETHKKHFEEALESKQVVVEVDLLDDVLASIDVELPLLVKIDVQGFEDKVIQGGVNTLQKASMVICELSFVELYRGQPLFDEIYTHLRNLGFDYAGSIEQLKSPEKNQILQADGVFVKHK